EKSPRAVMPSSAEWRFDVPGLRWVGVFVDQPLSEIAAVAQQLKLAAVQIHRDLDEAAVEDLRQNLPIGTEIWLALQPDEATASFNLAVDRWVLDRRKSGDPMEQQAFDWSAWATKKPANQLVLAGGLGPTNLSAARRLGFGLLDVNSGVESQPGSKSVPLIQTCFNALRGQGKECASA
ncbi:MAG: bifunctional indole-3-glycerol phosphate synthase/phosphoribosylanthranilate isomerase, partial [Acidobacteria bacterium]|nr:bifunctional indole-3-glycerol phosphate synthase/phosphoribosylanthranilate isomerase [Acidobacteriota bacterium]